MVHPAARLEGLIDGHAHLNEIEDMAGALERARAAGVARIVAVGMDVASNRRTLALAAAHPGLVLPAVGFHPWSIEEETIEENLVFVAGHLASCIALGEVGLDYKVRAKKPLQWSVFDSLLDLAVAAGKPVIVHARFSHQRCHRMVAASGIQKAVFHWYSGPLDLLERILADGYLVSCTPALAYSRAHQDAMRLAPPERILVETDCPVAYRGKVSEPAHLIDTLTHLSRLKALPIERVAEVTAANAAAFFGL